MTTGADPPHPAIVGGLASDTHAVFEGAIFWLGFWCKYLNFVFLIYASMTRGDFFYSTSWKLKTLITLIRRRIFR